jgi:hypothetical protein
MDPDGELPARPGSFYDEGNATWFEPHRVTSKLEARPLPRSKWPIAFDAPAGSVQTASASKLNSHRFIACFMSQGNERRVETLCKQSVAQLSFSVQQKSQKHRAF